MRTTPCFVSKPEAARRLVWNSYCANNLAVYLPACFALDPRLREQPPPPKVAVTVKGCDGRSAVGLIKEQQVPRENLILIAAPCDGMLDATVAQRLIGADEMVAAESADGTITIEDETGKQTPISREDLLAEACRFCTHKAPAVYDMTVGELPENQEPRAADDRFVKFSQKPAHERWEEFCREVSKCVLCKACRSVCPNCYCKACFADRTRPKWIDGCDGLEEAIFYHLGRMFHQAGRCVDCGACVRACSMAVDLRTFTYKLVKDAKDLFGYTPGVALEEVGLLMGFDADDPEDFITEPE
jgi:ferredoxin